MLFFGFFTKDSISFIWLGGGGGQTWAAYWSIGLTNDLKRQENACRLSFPSDRLITPNTLFALFTT